MFDWTPLHTAALVLVSDAVALGLLLKVIGLLRETKELVAYVRQETALMHRLRTPFASVMGMIRTLEAGAEAGGLSVETRKTIYAAIESEFAEFERYLNQEREWADVEAA